MGTIPFLRAISRKASWKRWCSARSGIATPQTGQVGDMSNTAPA